MKIPILTSKDNPLVRVVRLAAAQARRAPPELVLAEGLCILEEATSAGCTLKAALVNDNFGADRRERALLDAWSARNVPVRCASASLMRRLSDVVSPQGALALVQVPVMTLATLREQPNPLILCLCGIQDPGNLGTLLRTARAAGVSLVCSIAGTVSARSPKVIRSSAGAFFSIPVVEGLRAAEFFDYCRARRILLYQASPWAEHSCWTIDFKSPTAIILGNEARGLTQQEWSGVPSIRIPMTPGTESLNVAAAGSVLLFEALRQRSATATSDAIEA
jgi:TrmH family RNA methyltransferase